jgi:hypothetical protein
VAFKNAYAKAADQPFYRCPCCYFVTLRGRGVDDICPVCFWQDDGQDDHDADEVRGGPNRSLSLRDARRNYSATGASDPSRSAHVRPPSEQETNTRRSKIEDSVILVS